MTKRSLTLGFAGALLLSGGAIAQQGQAPQPGAPAPQPPAAPPVPAYEGKVRDDASYMIGYQAGYDLVRMLSRQGMSSVKSSDLESEAILKGFLAALEQQEPALDPEASRLAIESLGKVVMEREAAAAEANKKAGEAFLAENAKKEGVVTTDSGLQYKILKKGEGEVYEAPTEGQMDFDTKFKVKYTGRLIDGTEFDSSGDQSVEFDLRVVAGFREALTTMPEGSKWQLYLKPELGYGERRAGAKIAPNSTLIFDLELIDIVKPVPRPEVATPPIPVPAPGK